VPYEKIVLIFIYNIIEEYIIMLNKLILVVLVAGFVIGFASPSFAINGCCQTGLPKTCGGPVSVDHKGTQGCTLGWFKASCGSKWKDCEPKEWMKGKPKLKLKTK
jgi:hypothetical protein